MPADTPTAAEFFCNSACAYYPCHRIHEGERLNCMFCYCPLYPRADCGGRYSVLDNGVKDCSLCLLPHRDYAYILRKLKEGMP